MVYFPVRAKRDSLMYALILSVDGLPLLRTTGRSDSLQLAKEIEKRVNMHDELVEMLTTVETDCLDSYWDEQIIPKVQALLAKAREPIT